MSIRRLKEKALVYEMQSPMWEIVRDVHAKNAVEIAEDRDHSHWRSRETVILPDDERRSRVGRESRRSTRRPHRADECLYFTG
eukprot:2393504-Pleurochrysis_carterae.AAC.1